MITYLFGAGASCGVLPTIDNLPYRLEERARTLYEGANFHIDKHNVKRGNMSAFLPNHVNDITDDLNELSRISQEHSTIDTYAKKLFLKRDLRGLKKLKATLSAYFNFEHLINFGSCDKRYDSFWASILNEDAFKLPQNVRVISWNYDSQLEVSYSEYSEEYMRPLNLFNNHFNFRANNTHNSFKIFKLNGSANLYFNDNNPKNYFKNTKSILSEEQILDFIQLCNSVKHDNNFKSGITYAWEHGVDFVNYVSKDIAATEVLVIVGYSFPFFNRSIDRKIIQSMSSLDKIYIQDPRANEVTDSLLSIFSKDTSFPKEKIFPIAANNTQFFMPPEL